MVKFRRIDNFLDPQSHQLVWDLLNQPGWRQGAYSEDEGECYKFKHFAGYSASGIEQHTAKQILEELSSNSILLFRMWCLLQRTLLPGHALSRCYANCMPPGIGGGLHRDSREASHMSAVYYPDIAWSHRDAGETLFYDENEQDVLYAVAPRPNRLIVFPGTIPHVARSRSRRSSGDRITLMFKTLGWSSPDEL